MAAKGERWRYLLLSCEDFERRLKHEPVYKKKMRPLPNNDISFPNQTRHRKDGPKSDENGKGRGEKATHR